MKKSTMVELVEELQKLPVSDEINFMIAEALAGEYHDFKNKKYSCGKVASYQKLKALGYNSLANRIKEGEFDEEADEADQEMMRKDLANNDMGELGKILGL